MRNGLNNHVIDGLVNMFGDGHKPVTVCYFTGGTCVLLADPQVVEAMYTSKNKYFDKHPIIKDLTLCLTGRSILFAETTREWKEARKTLSPAFYKGKLVGLVEITRESVRVSTEKLKSLTARSASPKAQMDLINEFNTIFVRILLTTALGEDVSEHKVNYWENGKLIKVNVAYSLRETFHHLVERMAHVHVFFFPFMADVYLTPAERAMKANAGFLRELISQIVDRRRVAIQKDPKLKEAGDFLTILLTEPFFMNDNERIIDESLTFFFAGSQTSGVTAQNLMIALMKNPEYQTRLLNEFDTEIIQPHLQERVSKGELKQGDEVSDINVLDLISFDNGSNMKLFANCFNEGLRMQPPVYFSSTVRMSETVQCGPLKIR